MTDNTTKPTPGPYVAERVADEFFVMQGKPGDAVRKILARVPSHKELDAPGEQEALAKLFASSPELLESLKRAQKLVSLLTVRQVIEAGDEAIEAAGLNPWCMKEGLAEGHEHIGAYFIDAAIAKATGAEETQVSDEDLP